MASLRLNGAALACLVQSGLKAIWATCGYCRPFRGISSALSGAAVQQDHVGMLGVNLVETIPDEVVVVEVEPSGERDLWPGRQRDLGLGAALGCDEVAKAVDHRRGQGAVVDQRDPDPGRQDAGVDLEAFDGSRGRAPLQLRRSISVVPSAVMRSSSTDRLEPIPARAGFRCACSLSSSWRPMRSTARWNRLTVDQSRSSRSGSSRVSLNVATGRRRYRRRHR